MKTHFVIIGGGIAGLSTSFHLACNPNCQVTLIDPNQPELQTSLKAAGMIAPASEAQIDEQSFTNLFIQSAQYYPTFIEVLKKLSDKETDFQTSGTLLTAIDSDGVKDLQRIAKWNEQLDIPLQSLTREQTLDMEPNLSPRLIQSYYAKGDYYIDPIKLLQVLTEACSKLGVHTLNDTAVTHLQTQNDKIVSITLKHHQKIEQLKADQFILCSGLQHSIENLSDIQKLPLRGVKGQIVHVKALQNSIKHMIRVSHRYPTYLVPRQNGEIVIGATTEELVDTQVTAGGLLDLIYAAWGVLPMIYDLPVTQTLAGLRPTTPDHKPVLGQSPLKNLYNFLGLYRHGILLSPYLASELVKLLLDKQTNLVWDEYSIKRFM